MRQLDPFTQRLAWASGLIDFMGEAGRTCGDADVSRAQGAILYSLGSITAGQRKLVLSGVDEARETVRRVTKQVDCEKFRSLKARLLAGEAAVVIDEFVHRHSPGWSPLLPPGDPPRFGANLGVFRSSADADKYWSWLAAHAGDLLSKGYPERRTEPQGVALFASGVDGLSAARLCDWLVRAGYYCSVEPQ